MSKRAEEIETALKDLLEVVNLIDRNFMTNRPCNHLLASLRSAKVKAEKAIASDKICAELDAECGA